MENTELRQEKLCEHVCKAQQAIHDLYIELHYLACDGGVGRKPTS